MAGRISWLYGRRECICHTLDVVVAGELRGALWHPNALRCADTAKVCSQQDTQSMEPFPVQQVRKDTFWPSVG